MESSHSIAVHDNAEGVLIPQVRGLFKKKSLGELDLCFLKFGDVWELSHFEKPKNERLWLHQLEMS